MNGLQKALSALDEARAELLRARTAADDSPQNVRQSFDAGRIRTLADAETRTTAAVRRAHEQCLAAVKLLAD